MKLAITGGAGYIGGTASHQLVRAGHDVLVIDNLAQGHRAAVPAGAGFEEVDIIDRSRLSEVLVRHRPDAVLHFAALTIAPESVLDPAPYWATNVGGTLSLLDAMRQAETPALVHSSTAAVYGVPAEIPTPEQSPLAPINPYGASKFAAERAIAAYADAYGIACAALRYFNVAGASRDVGEDHDPETHLIPSALDAAVGLRGPLSVFGTDFPTSDGTAIRDYVHVEDLIDAHLLALDLLARNGTSLPPINLGTHDGASVKEVIAEVEKATGKPVPVTYADRRPGDPPTLIADATLAREMLGWVPRRSTLPELVGSAWEWRRRYPEGYDR